eukprot:jgi/Picre1/30353/NNA_005717.t1
MTQVQHHHEKLSTFLVSSESQGQASQNEIRRALESGDDEEKVEAMQQAIAALLNGEQCHREIAARDDFDLPEFEENLQHPNEYIRGVTLRFLCRITEEELLEPLVPSVIQNLEHRHSYVRKNAVMALSAVYKLPKGELLVPDAPELIEKLLRSEQDLGTRRNAFKMLSLHDQDRAVAYLFDNIERIADWGDVLQVAVLELIRKVCRSNPQAKGSDSGAASCFCKLLVKQSDNNVKLIVLDRLAELKKKHKDIMSEMLMDMLRALSAPNLDVREKVLSIAMDLVNARSVDEVVTVLKRRL